MTSWRRALTFGFLAWLIPFAISFTIASLKESWRSLFESIMAVTVSATVAVFAVLYFRRTGNRTLGEGAGLGALWLVISVLIDLPLMLSPPLSYSPVEYAADVGLTYLMMPVITVCIAVAAGLGPRTALSSKSG
jgi:hypothetical protein